MRYDLARWLRKIAIIVMLFLLSSCIVSQREHQESVQSLEAEIQEMESQLAVAQKQQERAVKQVRDSVRLYQAFLRELREEEILIGDDSLNLVKLAQKITQLQLIRDSIQLERDSFSLANSNLKSNTATLKNFIHDLLNTPYVSFASEINAFDNTFHTYVVDLRTQEVQLFWKDAQGKRYQSLDHLKQSLDKGEYELVFATNAGMYTPRYDPQGLYIEKGKELIPIDLQEKENLNFYMKPNGVFYIDKSKQAGIDVSEVFAASDKPVEFATQSGPMLVIDGKIHPVFNKGSKNLRIRSGVGIINPDKLVFAISNQPVNFYDFATLFRDYFGCRNALYLDGAISRMYLPGIKRSQLGGQFGPMIGILK